MCNSNIDSEHLTVALNIDSLFSVVSTLNLFFKSGNMLNSFCKEDESINNLTQHPFALKFVFNYNNY